MEEDTGYPLTFGVFAPNFQGAFIGEIVNQIRQYCQMRGYRFIGYSTGTKGDYNCLLGINALDGAIIVTDAVSNDFAQELVKRKIATVSIGYDYFPIDIPLISSDNAEGATLVFNYLRSREHKTLSFVGDLSQYDIRKRYERYAELMEEHKLELSDDLLINTRNSDISGGIKAAEEFIARGCNSTAVFCASGLNAIGFVNQLRENGIELNDNLEVVGYDAMPLISVLTPNITAVDQNVHLIAYRAVSLISDIKNGNAPAERQITIAPKLISKEDVANNSENPYLATSVDLPEIYNPGYVSSLINNHFIWTNEVNESALDDIMSLAPIFAKFMKNASFTRLAKDNHGKELTYLMKIYHAATREKLGSGASENFCSADDFPPSRLQNDIYASSDTVSHFFIRTMDRIWGVLSLYGDTKRSAKPASYLYLSGQMDTLVRFMGLAIERKLYGKAATSGDNKEKASSAADEKYTITWYIGKHDTEWSKEALKSIGMVNPMDINIYRHMDITDRVHPDEQDKLRPLIAACATDGESFSYDCHIKSKSGKYIPFYLEGIAKIDAEKSVTEVLFMISPSDA